MKIFLKYGVLSLVGVFILGVMFYSYLFGLPSRVYPTNAQWSYFYTENKSLEETSRSLLVLTCQEENYVNDFESSSSYSGYWQNLEELDSSIVDNNYGEEDNCVWKPVAAFKVSKTPSEWFTVSWKDKRNTTYFDFKIALSSEEEIMVSNVLSHKDTYSKYDVKLSEENNLVLKNITKFTATDFGNQFEVFFYSLLIIILLKSFLYRKYFVKKELLFINLIHIYAVSSFFFLLPFIYYISLGDLLIKYFGIPIILGLSFLDCFFFWIFRKKKISKDNFLKPVIKIGILTIIIGALLLFIGAFLFCLLGIWRCIP